MPAESPDKDPAGGYSYMKSKLSSVVTLGNAAQVYQLNSV